MSKEIQIGEMVPYNWGYLGFATDLNYLPCDGRYVLYNMYKTLFDVLSIKTDVKVKTEIQEYKGKTYHVRLFSLPDLRDSQGVCGWIRAK